MIDIGLIKDNPNLFLKLMEQRNVKVSTEDILSLDKEKKQKISDLQDLQAERNSISKLIGIYKKEEKNSKTLENKVIKIKEQILENEKSVKLLDEKLNSILLKLPNLPSSDVPIGNDETYNKEIFKKSRVAKTCHLFKISNRLRRDVGINISLECT